MTLTRNRKRNALRGYSTIAPYAGGRIVVRLKPSDQLCSLDLPMLSMKRGMTVKEYISRFTFEHEELENVFIMPRDLYISETSH